jgi:hypothetical protein
MFLFRFYVHVYILIFTMEFESISFKFDTRTIALPQNLVRDGPITLGHIGLFKKMYFPFKR